MVIANRKQYKQFAGQRIAMNEVSNTLGAILPNFVQGIRNEFGEAGHSP